MLKSPNTSIAFEIVGVLYRRNASRSAELSAGVDSVEFLQNAGLRARTAGSQTVAPGTVPGTRHNAYPTDYRPAFASALVL
jgi:hypothetical protein